MTNCIINRKRYTVAPVRNMVLNWYFTDKNNTNYLVDAEDVQAWADDEGLPWDGVKTVIEYARYMASISDGGVFWWTVKTN